MCGAAATKLTDGIDRTSFPKWCSLAGTSTAKRKEGRKERRPGPELSQGFPITLYIKGYYLSIQPRNTDKLIQLPVLINRFVRKIKFLSESKVT